LGPLDLTHTQLGIRSLFAFIAKQNENSANESKLFEEIDNIYLTFALKKLPPPTRKLSNKIIPLGPLPYGINDNLSICLIVSDERQPLLKQQLIKCESPPIPQVKKILSFTKLRKNYSQYKSKRELLNEYDLFLCDAALLPSLPKHLGVKFFQRKKQPIAIKFNNTLSSVSVIKAVKRVLMSTFYHFSSGPTIVIRCGDVEHSRSEIVENVKFIISKFIEKIPKNWSNITAIYIKTKSSIAIPIYHSNLLNEPVWNDDEQTQQSEKENTQTLKSNQKSTSNQDQNKSSSVQSQTNNKRKRQEAQSTKNSTGKSQTEPNPKQQIANSQPNKKQK